MQPANNDLFIQGGKVESDGWTSRLAPGHRVKATSKSILSPRPRPPGSILCEVPESWKTAGVFVPGSLEPDLGSRAVVHSVNVAAFLRHGLWTAAGCWEIDKRLGRRGVHRNAAETRA